MLEASMTRSDLCAFIGKNKLGVLGSISPLGTPQAALVGIGVTPALEIVFDTLTNTRKYANLVANPAASFVIGWDGEITVQYEGEAWVPAGAELAKYKEFYFAAWPDGPARQSWPLITYFVISPKWIRYSDYDQRPPVIEEFTF